jgi:hypothetical protein
MESTAGWRRSAALLLALTIGVPGRGATQFTEPVRKSDLIRMLTAGTLPRAEIAALIRKNCLAFRPTERDRADLRAAGADSPILDAVAGCPAGGELRAILPAQVQAAAGSQANVTVQLLRGTVPQPRAVLVLRGSGALTGGQAQDAQATTDERGVATFRVAAGTRAGSYELSVRVVSGTPLSAPAVLTFTTTPARTVRAETRPREVVVQAGAQTSAAVSVVVRDVYGNPVSGLPLELRGVTAQLGSGVWTATTALDGQASFAVSAATVGRGGEVGVYTRGVRLASLTVRVEAVALSSERTGFVTGANQHGVVHAALSQPLVFEVRGSSGAPVAGQSVSFVVTGGEVAPAAALTDSTGSVRVQVRLGDRAGPLIVTANVGTLTRQATVYGDPGPPHEIGVERNGIRVTDRLLVQSRDLVTVHVVARDAYGNATVLGSADAMVVGPAIRLRGVAGTTVAFEPRRNGSAQLALHAAGLDARVPVEVALPRTAALDRPWAIGVRGNWLSLDYYWSERPNVTDGTGFAGALFLRRALAPAVSVAIGGHVGATTADTVNGSVTAVLLEAYARFEVVPLPRASVTPVLSLSGGAYRLRSDPTGRAIYHTALFGSAGAGLDVAVGSTVTLELRGEGQRMIDFGRGRVASLWPVGLGIRIAL